MDFNTWWQSFTDGWNAVVVWFVSQAINLLGLTTLAKFITGNIADVIHNINPKTWVSGKRGAGGVGD